MRLTNSNLKIRFPTLSIAAVLTTAAIAACTPNPHQIDSSKQTGIVNGINGVAGDVGAGGLAESVVFIEATFADSTVSDCSGTLIGPRIVLTAAHCVQLGDVADSVSIRLHALDVSKSADTALSFTSDQFVVHPGYIKAGDASGAVQNSNDLALILLSEPVPEGTRIAALPSPATPLSPTLVSIGYGEANDRHGLPVEKTGVGVLRHTTFSAPSANAQIPADMQGLLVLSSAKSSTCEGDSGGPLMLANGKASTNQLIGVAESITPGFTSAQMKDYRAAQNAERPDSALDAFYKKYPTATECFAGNNNFVDLRPHLDWIKATIAQLTQSSDAQPTVPPTNQTSDAPSATPAVPNTGGLELDPPHQL